MDEIVYYDRYIEQTCREKVYGDRFLRWTYGTTAGRVALATAVKRLWFSRWYGWRMDQPASRRKIAPFVEEFGLNVDEFARAPRDFDNFNEFFARALKPAARPIDPHPSVAVFPADGRHLCVPDISRSDGLFVKGEMFDLPKLLDDAELADEFAAGSLLLSRLCPVDYHRFHFPVAGRAAPARLINGPLYSVNPIALSRNIQILVTNKRVLTRLQSETFGKVLLLEIGATCVGTIQQTYQPDTFVSKGDEKGMFRFGGSATIVVFQAGRVRFDDDLLHHSSRHRELYGKMGDHMATLVGT